MHAYVRVRARPSVCVRLCASVRVRTCALAAHLDLHLRLRGDVLRARLPWENRESWSYKHRYCYNRYSSNSSSKSIGL